jgi:hypothetical protein
MPNAVARKDNEVQGILLYLIRKGVLYFGSSLFSFVILIWAFTRGPVQPYEVVIQAISSLIGGLIYGACMWRHESKAKSSK